jgi:glycosyltransferase involved in cell wall biosynthesis
MVADKIATKDHRIKIIHTENGGVTAARRIGYEHALGKYIMFVDSDDKLLDDALS